MARVEIQLPLRVAAPVDEVFAFFADHEKMARLFGGRAEHVRDGQGHRGGVGSVRAMGSGPLRFEETVTLFKLNQAIDYTVSRGGPVKNHLGQIRFFPEGQETRVEYVIRFDPKLPGTGGLIAGVLRRAFQANATRALSALERR